MIVNDRGFAYCQDCEAGNRHDNWRQMGETVQVTGRSRAGGDSAYTFFQCTVCGHIWQELDDGERGRGYTALTTP